MRKIVVALAIALIALSVVYAAPAKNVPAVIGIHVGPAHPAFIGFFLDCCENKEKNREDKATTTWQSSR